MRNEVTFYLLSKVAEIGNWVRTDVTTSVYYSVSLFCIVMFEYTLLLVL